MSTISSVQHTVGPERARPARWPVVPRRASTAGSCSSIATRGAKSLGQRASRSIARFPKPILRCPDADAVTAVLPNPGAAYPDCVPNQVREWNLRGALAGVANALRPP